MQNGRPQPARTSYADVAQLVEHHLAKVDVASSNLVVRSLSFMQYPTCRLSRTAGSSGSRAIGAAVARFPDTEEVTGSIPVSPTAAAPRSCFFVARIRAAAVTRCQRHGPAPAHALGTPMSLGLGSNAEERPGSATEGRCPWVLLTILRARLSDLIDGNEQAIKDGISKAGDFVDSKTGGKYADQVDTVQKGAAGLVDKVDPKPAHGSGRRTSRRRRATCSRGTPAAGP